MAKKKSKYHQRLVPRYLVVISFISIILTAIVFVNQQNRQNTISQAQNVVSSEVTDGQNFASQSTSSSTACQNGKCYSCSGSNCMIQCSNGECTCEGDECQLTEVTPGNRRSMKMVPLPPVRNPSFEARRDSGSATGSSSSSISCVNGKCYTCASEGQCSVSCNGGLCTCSPGECRALEGVSPFRRGPLPTFVPGQVETGRVNSGNGLGDMIGRFFQGIFRALGL